MSQVRCGVIGGGVVGSILSCHLSKAGHDVYIADIVKNVADAINADGIHITGPIDCHSRRITAFTKVEDLADLDLSYLFVCIKTTAMADVLPKLRAFDNGKTFFVSVQNGIETEEEFIPFVSKDKIFRIVVNYAGVREKPGHIRSTFFHPPNYIGPVSVKEVAAAKEIAKICTAAGVATEYADDIKTKVWRKAILNSALIPTSVITRLTMKHLMEHEDARYIVVSQVKQFLKVAAAEGHIMEDDYLDKAIHYLSNAGDHKPSTLVDFEAGQPLELDFLNVKIQEYADKHGILCEENRVIIGLIKGLLRHRELEKVKRLELEALKKKQNSQNVSKPRELSQGM